MDSGLAGTIGIVFFFTVFCGILIWVLNPKNKKKIEDLKNIPLEDEEQK